MLSYKKALITVLSHAKQLPRERVSLLQSPGRVLARDIPADRDMPPHDLSTMDGYACRAMDRNKPLRVVETIAAGTLPRKRIGHSQCTRIMTGAALPQGADCVVMFEDTECDDRNGLVRVLKKSDHRNLRRRGEDARKGTVVLRKGTVITPSIVAVLAAVGRPDVPVHRRPRVGIIATGDELVEPAQKPRGACIRNSNGWQVAAQVHDMGAVPVYYGIVKDDPPALRRVVSSAFGACEVVLLTGGVSMGDFDYVPEVLKGLGVRIMFDTLAIKPGKPTVFGVRDNKALFGLPGNPVSAFVVFEMLIKPFLYGMAGHRYVRRRVQGALAHSFLRQNASRMEFRPVTFTPDGAIEQPQYHGSAHIHAYVNADGILTVPAGITTIPAGTTVQVALL